MTKKCATLDKRKQERAAAAELANLEILSKINLPEVRWNFKEAKYMLCQSRGISADNNKPVDLNKPMYRHLLDQKWRKKGRPDRLVSL